MWMSCLTNVCHPFILILESALHLWGLSERNKVLEMFSSVYVSVIEIQMDGRGMVAKMLQLFQLPSYLQPSDFLVLHIKMQPPTKVSQKLELHSLLLIVNLATD